MKPSRIQEMPVAVVVWTMQGCPACDQFKPRILQAAQKYASCLPTIIADVDRFPGAADHFRVNATPTTMILRYGKRTFRHLQGNAPDAEIESLFQAAMWGLDCQL